MLFYLKWHNQSVWRQEYKKHSLHHVLLVLVTMKFESQIYFHQGGDSSPSLSSYGVLLMARKQFKCLMLHAHRWWWWRSALMSTWDGSNSPTSLASAGTTSLQQDKESFEVYQPREGTIKLLETSCQELVSILDELHWQHSHVHVTWLSCECHVTAMCEISN